MPDFQCPYCYTTGKYDEHYLKDGAYVCDGIQLDTDFENESTEKCGTLLKAYCKVCDKYYDEDRFGKLNNTYVCKTCGTVQWGVTEYKKNNEETWFPEFFKNYAKNLHCACSYNAKADEDVLDDGLIVCKKCGHIISGEAACFKCKQSYKFKRFGYDNGVYRCKKCDAVQWGLTEYARKKNT